jgi:hypothetical protein
MSFCSISTSISTSFFEESSTALASDVSSCFKAPLFFNNIKKYECAVQNSSKKLTKILQNVIDVKLTYTQSIQRKA